MQLRELNETLVSRLLSLEAREKARAEKMDEMENMNTAKAATRKYKTGNDPPLSWARVVANGIDSKQYEKNRDDGGKNTPEGGSPIQRASELPLARNEAVAYRVSDLEVNAANVAAPTSSENCIDKCVRPRNGLGRRVVAPKALCFNNVARGPIGGL